MVIVSVLYPNRSDSHFDFTYYLERHIPLVRSRWQSIGLVSDTLVRGTATLDGAAPAFHLIGLLSFASQESLAAALAAAGDEIIGDIPNFTDVTPHLQVNDLL